MKPNETRQQMHSCALASWSSGGACYAKPQFYGLLVCIAAFSGCPAALQLEIPCCACRACLGACYHTRPALYIVEKHMSSLAALQERGSSRAHCCRRCCRRHLREQGRRPRRPQAAGRCTAADPPSGAAVQDRSGGHSLPRPSPRRLSRRRQAPPAGRGSSAAAAPAAAAGCGGCSSKPLRRSKRSRQ